MRSFLIRSGWLAICFIVGSSCLTTQGSQKSDATWPPIRREVPAIYESVMDTLFPRIFQGHTVVVLRFLPGFAPESQIVIYTKDGQTYEVLLGLANKNVNTEMGRMLEAGEQDEKAIAGKIRVDVKKVLVPKEVVADWISTFAKLNFVVRGNDNIVVFDGTVHRLWYEGAATARLHFSYVDPFDGDHEKSHSVVRWMNRVKADVEKYAKASP